MAEIVSLRKEEKQDLILSSLSDGVLRLTLNNLPANALSIEVMTLLLAHLAKAKEDKAVRVIILASAAKIFSAGHDLKELTAHRQDPDQGRAFFENTFSLCAELMVAITKLPKPVIAEVDGLATAAGCQLVSTCDLAICTDTSTFCTPGVNIGLFCSTPMVAITRAAHRKQAMEMLLTGETIDASTAKDFGIINRIVPKQYLTQVVNKYAAVIASKSAKVLKTGKEAFYAQAEMSLEDAYAYTGRIMADNMGFKDAEEGIGAFLEKRHAHWSDE